MTNPVTLPREVVKLALESMDESYADTRQGRALADVLRAALEQPQNHVPDIGNMLPAGWKLVPVEPTCGMVLAGEHSMKQHDFFRLDAGYRAMLDAAPQPPALEQQVEKESTCKESLQAEQEPVAYGLFRKDSSEIDWDADHVFSNEPWGVMYDDEEVRPLYTSPHPKREPLTHYEIHELFRRSWDYCQDGDEIKAFARAIEAAHDIGNKG